METNGDRDLERDLEQVERQRLDVYCAQVTPVWAWPTFGVAVMVFLASFESHRVWVPAVAAVGYATFVGAWVAAVNKRSGVQPRLRGMPKPLFGELVRFWVGGAVVALAVVALGVAVSFLLAGAVAGAITIVGGRLFDRRYRRRADALVPGGSLRAP